MTTRLCVVTFTPLCNTEACKAVASGVAPFAGLFLRLSSVTRAVIRKVGVGNLSVESKVGSHRGEAAGPVEMNVENSSSSKENLSSRHHGVVSRQRVRIEDLRIGGLHKGKISVVESYGVFVDIGTHVDGFIHISRLGISSEKRRVEDVVQVGQIVTVQIVDMDPRANSLSLVLAADGCIETFDLQPLMLSEREILNRATSRRANKIARCLETPSRRRIMTLETRQRLKAHRRAVMAEQQAFQLHQARLRTSVVEKFEAVPVVDDCG